MKKYTFLFLLLAGVLLLNSCITGKKVIYVEDMLADTIYTALKPSTLKIQKNDRLNIWVSARTPELAVPFNQGGAGISVRPTGDVVNSSGGATQHGAYLVDENGNIEFPILGTIKVEGMSTMQARDYLKKQLMDEQLIAEPIVKVEMTNLSVSVVGEVRSQKIISSPDSRLTILSAIAAANGITKDANPNRVHVIREENGQRKIYTHDIESKDIFDSPGYYLQQNDIVYVEAKAAELDSGQQLGWRIVTTSFGLVAAVFSIINFIK